MLSYIVQWVYFVRVPRQEFTSFSFPRLNGRWVVVGRCLIGWQCRRCARFHSTLHFHFLIVLCFSVVVRRVLYIVVYEDFVAVVDSIVILVGTVRKTNINYTYSCKFVILLYIQIQYIYIYICMYICITLLQSCRYNST